MTEETSAIRLKEDEALLGSYEYLNLHTVIKHWPPPERSEIERGESLDEITQLALRRYTYIHEARHFHDFFGTLAGMSLFFAHFEIMRSFAILFEVIRRSGEKWCTPFPSWAGASKFQDIYSRFLRAWSLYRRTSARFMQAFRPSVGPQPRAEEYVAYLRASDSDDYIATFPFDLGIVELGVRFGVYYPVSLVALLEGNAQTIQRTLIDAEFPSVASQLTPEKIEHRAFSQVDGLEDSIALSTQPYNVTDFMVTKYLRLAGEPSFARETIMRLTDITLSSSAMVPLKKDEDLGLPTAFQMNDVGRSFVDHLKATNLKAIKNGTIEYPESMTVAYSRMLSDVIDFEKPEDVTYEGDLLSPLNLLESTLRHHVIAPLIRLRLSNQHKVFYSTYEYMRRFQDFPKIPVIEHAGGLQFAPYMSDKTIDAWSKYIFLSRLVSELGNGAQVVTCPRSAGAVGAIGDMSFCADGDCKKHISKGKCKSWYREKPRALPQCLFADLLRRTGAL